MAIRNIRYDGDDILRKVCRPVEKMDDRTLTLIDDMSYKSCDNRIRRRADR